MQELNYPFNAECLIKKKRSLKRQLLADSSSQFIDKKIAILGGQTTEDIKLILELFLLNYGIRPAFYESEFNKYYEDGMFPNPELEEFAPDLIYICTCVRNITDFPKPSDSADDIKNKADALAGKFKGLWDHIEETYRCPIIKNMKNVGEMVGLIADKKQ